MVARKPSEMTPEKLYAGLKECERLLAEWKAKQQKFKDWWFTPEKPKSRKPEDN